MEFSVPGFIKRFCTPNAMLTFAEYIMDYANESNARKGWALIEKELQGLSENADEVRKRIEEIKNGKRDLYF